MCYAATIPPTVLSVSSDNFGPLIAYLFPGTTVLLGASLFSGVLRSWFYPSYNLATISRPAAGGPGATRAGGGPHHCYRQRRGLPSARRVDGADRQRRPGHRRLVALQPAAEHVEEQGMLECVRTMQAQEKLEAELLAQARAEAGTHE